MSDFYHLSDAEFELLKSGTDDPNIPLGYFTRLPGQEIGWQLDYNFTNDGKWQVEMCLAQQKFIIAIGGIGSGKSLGVGMSAIAHALVTPDFKFLNIARESWQSELMYKMILDHARGTMLEELILSSPKRPYPSIAIGYEYQGRQHYSTLEFMSIGEDRDATNVFSWRGDWINVDEAGRLDNLGEITGNLSSRGTGVTPRGRPYIGRISLISNPFDNPELWALFDIAAADSQDSLAITINTSDNKNVTPEQLKNMKKFIPVGEDLARFLTGNRPEGRGSYFGVDGIALCTSELLSLTYLEKAKEEKAFIKSVPHLGCFELKIPPESMHTYFILGDPGTGTAPARNAPVLMVFDVTEVPDKSAKLVYFWWGNGNGSISPWTNSLLSLVDEYRPLFAGVDSTGTQKNTAEIINTQFIYQKNKSIPYITGMDFSGGHKYTYLISLRMSLESQSIIWPSICKGITSQLRSYDDKADKASGSKHPQDLVATLAMAAYAIRAHFGLDLSKDSQNSEAPSDQAIGYSRYSRTSSNRRPYNRAEKHQAKPR